MTLVICCVTPDFLLQASDRRLTSPNGRVFDDARNKVVFETGRAVWAYTGISGIGTPLRPTDDWLVDVLASTKNVIDSYHIRQHAAKAVRQVHGPSGYTTQERRVLRRLAFICSFYGDHRITEEGKLEPSLPIPVVRIISNFASQDSAGKLQWLPESTEEFSTWTVGPLGEGSIPRLVEFGQSLTTSVRRDLYRSLQRCDRRRVGVEAYARLLAHGIQRCHDEGNFYVGRNVMVAWMRRDASPHLGPNGVLYDAPLVPLLDNPAQRDFFLRPRDQPSTGRGYFYLPGDRHSREHFAPSWVGDGVAQVGMQMTHQGPGGRVSVDSWVQRLAPHD